MFTDIIRVYCKKDKYLVLNPTVPSWIVTNVNGVLILKCYKESLSFEKIADEFGKHCPSFSRQVVINFLEKVAKTRLFQEIPKYNYSRGLLRSLYLNMTEKCNLHCSYCYAAARKETKDQYLTYVEYVKILEQLKNINSNSVITFTGGEPLLSVNTIPVAQKARELGFDTYLLSNGTLINEDNVDLIANIFGHIKISMDGSTKECYGKYRGEENFEKAKNAINLLIKHEADVGVSMVVTKENKSDVKNMVSIWGNRMNFMPLFPMGNALNEENENALSGKEYYKILSDDVRIEPFADIISVIQKNGKPILKCAMADSELSISATGDVYPCQLLHNKDCYLGNIHEKNLEEILGMDSTKKFGTHTIYKIKKCQDCDMRLICGGACQARHYSENGTIDFAGDFCEYEKEGIINGLINKAQMVEVK